MTCLRTFLLSMLLLTSSLTAQAAQLLKGEPTGDGAFNAVVGNFKEGTDVVDLCNWLADKKKDAAYKSVPHCVLKTTTHLGQPVAVIRLDYSEAKKLMAKPVDLALKTPTAADAEPIAPPIHGKPAPPARATPEGETATTPVAPPAVTAPPAAPTHTPPTVDVAVLLAERDKYRAALQEANNAITRLGRDRDAIEKELAASKSIYDTLMANKAEQSKRLEEHRAAREKAEQELTALKAAAELQQSAIPEAPERLACPQQRTELTPGARDALESRINASFDRLEKSFRADLERHDNYWLHASNVNTGG